MSRYVVGLLQCFGCATYRSDSKSFSHRSRPSKNNRASAPVSLPAAPPKNYTPCCGRVSNSRQRILPCLWHPPRPKGRGGWSRGSHEPERPFLWWVWKGVSAAGRHGSPVWGNRFNRRLLRANPNDSGGGGESQTRFGIRCFVQG